MTYFQFDQKIRLARSLVTKSSPAYVQYYITSRCNLTCEQCNIIYGDAAAREMSVDQIKRAAENLAEIGVCIVLLIGGEPFVRRDLPEIVKAFTEVGIHVRLQTNGLASRSALEACVRNGAHDISISLDSLNPDTQDVINGGFSKSWNRAIETVSTINEIFPDSGTAFFGSVIMPRNLQDIPNVIKFATAIGWGVSLVPVHVTSRTQPKGFRAFNDDNILTFEPSKYEELRGTINKTKKMKRDGYLLYDSDEYLDDSYRFLTGEPIRWRRRNGNVCDSPNLYFAIAPDGAMKVCCDYEMPEAYSVHAPNFPSLYHKYVIHEQAYKVTRSCDGCMYGSYPEISISARFLGPMLERIKYFNIAPPKLKRLRPNELADLAMHIREDPSFDTIEGKYS